MLSSKGENTENKIVKMFVIVGDSERHMGVHYTIFFMFTYVGKQKEKAVSSIPARDKDAMGGAPATILDHEVDLKMEAPGKAEIWKKANDNKVITLVWEFLHRFHL